MNEDHVISTEKSPAEDAQKAQNTTESLGALLYLNGDYTDVDLVVDGVRFPCHRAVLATRSVYFRALLFGSMKESNEHEVKLQVSSPTAFKEILRYIYTYDVCLTEKSEETVLEILGLSHQFGLTQLHSMVSECLKTRINSHNVYQIKQAATVYELTSLAKICGSFIDRHAVEILKEEFILNLTSKELKDLISSDSFCAPEIDIFRTVAKWVKQNKPTNCEEVIGLIRFSLMNLNDLLEIVRPEQIVSDKVILDAIEVIKSSSRSNLPFRGRLCPEENLASPSQGASVLSGKCKESLLHNDRERPEDNAYTWHDISDDQGIVIMLGALSIINCIKLRLYDKNGVSFSYIIQVSVDMNTWETVIDYRHYVCRSWQELYFAPRPVQYVKIVGTWCSSDEVNVFQIVSFACSSTDRWVQLEGDIIVPSENIAFTKKHARVIQGDSNGLIDGRWSDSTKFTRHALGNGAIVVQLAQPYMLDSMRLLLWNRDDRSYSYYIEVSIDQGKWTTVVDHRKQGCKSWQNIRFKKTPVVYVRITGTHSSASKNFYCVYLECPARNVKPDQV